MSRRPSNPPDAAATPRPPSLVRRCALGLWLCGIALLGAVEFRRHAAAGVDGSLTLVTWMWLVGSVVTGAISVALLVRELRRRR